MSNIFEKSIAYSLEIHRPGIRRKVDSARMKLAEEGGKQPEADAIGVSKELIQSPEYDAIVSMDNAIRTRVARVALPAPFRSGVYLLPLTLVQRVDNSVQEYQAQRAVAVTQFLNTYEAAKERARETLGDLFDAADYAPVDKIADAFSVTANYLELGLPDKLSGVDKSIFQREQADFQRRLSSAQTEIQQALRVTFNDLLSHMLERLTPSADGKKKIFRDSLIDNLREFMRDFSDRNIADDKELDDVVTKARAVLEGRTADQLRAGPIVTESLRDALAPIKTQLDTMVCAAPSRKFDFSE